MLNVTYTDSDENDTVGLLFSPFCLLSLPDEVEALTKRSPLSTLLNNTSLLHDSQCSSHTNHLSVYKVPCKIAKTGFYSLRENTCSTYGFTVDCVTSYE